MSARRNTSQRRQDGHRRPNLPRTPDVRVGHSGNPENALWTALLGAGPEGATVASLMRVTGMGRRWVYYRLGGLAADGQAEQVTRGTWRAIPDGKDGYGE